MQRVEGKVTDLKAIAWRLFFLLSFFLEMGKQMIIIVKAAQ